MNEFANVECEVEMVGCKWSRSRRERKKEDGSEDRRGEVEIVGIDEICV